MRRWLSIAFLLILATTSLFAVPPEPDRECRFEELREIPWTDLTEEALARHFDQAIHAGILPNDISFGANRKRFQNLRAATLRQSPGLRRVYFRKIMERLRATSTWFNFARVDYRGGDLYLGPNGDHIWVKSDGQLMRIAFDNEFSEYFPNGPNAPPALNDAQLRQFDEAPWNPVQ